MLAFDGMRSMDVLAMGSEPVVVLWAGGASIFFGPVAFCIVVQVLMDADPGVAAVNEVSLVWGPVRGSLISWVLLGGFDAADALLVLACLAGHLDGLAVHDVFYSDHSGADLVFWQGRLLFSRPLCPSLDGFGLPRSRVVWEPLSLRVVLDGGGV